MRIWKRTDYIGEGEHRRELNVHGVALGSEELPLCLAYNHNIPPIGRVTNICIVADPDAITGEITGDIVWLDPQWQKVSVQIIDDYVCLVDVSAQPERSIVARYRLAMYATNIIEFMDKAGRRVVEGCIIREVSLIPEEAWPLSEKKPAEVE